MDLAADGSYAYTLDNAAANVQGLRGGQQVSESFTYMVSDGLAAVETQLTIAIVGSNDGPQANADTASVREDDGLAASGNVLANDSDVDQGTVLSVSNAGVFVGHYGTLTLSGDGSYTYTLDHANPLVQALGRDAAVTEVFSYTATDDDAQPLSAASELTVTVHGSNDGPVAGADTAEVTEDSATTVSGNVLANDSDVDAGDSLSVANAGTYAGLYGNLVLAVDGSYTYTLDNSVPGIQQLGRGQALQEQFVYVTTDGLAEASATLTIKVVGSNDAPIVVSPVADQSGRENQLFSFTLPNSVFTDRDQGYTLTYSAWLVDESGQLQALPSWLGFNAVTRSFSGTPGSSNGGDYRLRISATDGAGAVASDDFMLAIADQGSLGGGRINGTNGNDVLNGGSGNEFLYAGNGDDLLFGNAGNDYLDGGNGNDILYAGSGNDKLYGGNGDDELHGEAGDDLLDGDNGNDYLLDLKGNNSFHGGNHNDIIQAGADADRIDTGNEADLADAGAGDDLIGTGNGDDWIAAGQGNDWIDAGNG
ncbi:MAG: VCBS domain-containing protein, partial [Polaromonas sp.]